MGCGTSNTPRASSEHPKTDTAMKAAMLIQQWYRRYVARLEARHRYTWHIFQTLEYAGEQDQLKLYNFFNDLLAHMENSEDKSLKKQNILTAVSSPSSKQSKGSQLLNDENEELMRLTNPDDIEIPSNYNGPHIQFPLNPNHLQCLIEAFKNKQKLHAKYLVQLLHQVRLILRSRSNITHVFTSAAKQVTICGDLHGKLDDLFVIFYKNGLPSQDNPYIFNGDFVDRGPHSVEVAVILFACTILNPMEVFINRGNHEDHVMNLRYGFIKEIMSKYGTHATQLVRLFEDVFSWLPLASVIDNRILVAHGGISDRTDLNKLGRLDRHKYLSALRPPLTDGDEKVDILEWRQVLDILWSDPRMQYGCQSNTFRGGGSYFGPDITEAILTKHNLSMLIRSHECKLEGYEFTHNEQVLTIFSASNYYEVGSNKGAYVKVGPDLQPHIVQYMVTKGFKGRKLTIKQRVGMVENSAFKSLQSRIYANKTVLMVQFKKRDPKNTGVLTVTEWCDVMSTTLNMNLPWRNVCQRLAESDSNDLVRYESTFDDYIVRSKYDGSQADLTVTEALYRNKDSLETIFRAIDTDHSGLISMDEFEEACDILGQHTRTPTSKEDVLTMARNMDMNKDGFIDFNEFLEAFRIVDQFGKELKEMDEEGSANGSPTKV